MTVIRRSLALLVTLFAAVLAFASGAGAAPYSNQFTVSVSNTNPAVGGTIIVSGSGATANGQVGVDLHTTVTHLATVTADASGNWTATVTLPTSATCSHTIVGTDATTGHSSSVAITIGPASACGGTTGGGTTGGGLSNTGVAVVGLSSLGVVLLLGGGLLLLAGRRRKAQV